MTSTHMQVFEETRVFTVSGDAERLGHQLADDRGNMVAMLLRTHSVKRGSFSGDIIDDVAGRDQRVMVRTANIDAKFLIDAGKEFHEWTAHFDAMTCGRSSKPGARGKRVFRKAMDVCRIAYIDSFFPNPEHDGK